PARAFVPESQSSRPVRLAEARSGSAAQPARLLDVVVYLLDQHVDGGKPALAAQALQEVDPQPPAVEVDVAVDQVGLQQHGQVAAELGPNADVDGGADAVGAGRVDPVAGI